jgi:hypothetical protein
MPSIDNMTPPPVPDIGAYRPNALVQTARPPNALAASMPSATPRLPAPSHGQTVAALRHFGAISREMKALLADPAVGRSSMKSQIIDAVTKLVSDRIISAPQAVEQLGTVPDAPFQQKQWITNHYEQSLQSAGFVLDHHAAAFRGVPEDAIDKSESPDDHMDMMASLGGHYGRA